MKPMTRVLSLLPAAVTLAALAACGTAPPAPPPEPPPRPLEYAIAVHGGAGVIPRDDPDRERYEASLRAALTLGRDMLADGATALDTVEAVVRFLEDDPLFNAGRGAVFNAEGGHELDASIMDGATLAAGAVASVTTVKNPVSLARLVMERTRHVLLAGAGAEAFADEMGVERVPNRYFDTERRRRALEKFLKRQEADKPFGTVGCVAMDRAGNLAAATSTGGLTGKRWGRIGDTPVIGAGNYADNRTCAVSGTGVGEEFIRHAVGFHVSALIRYGGRSLDQAVREVVHGILQEGQGGVIAMDKAGRIAMDFNTPGMFRGAADSSGRFETAIWEADPQALE